MVVFTDALFFLGCDPSATESGQMSIGWPIASGKQWPHLKKAYMMMAGTDLMTVAVKKQKGRSI